MPDIVTALIIVIVVLAVAFVIALIANPGHNSESGYQPRKGVVKPSGPPNQGSGGSKPKKFGSDDGWQRPSVKGLPKFGNYYPPDPVTPGPSAVKFDPKDNGTWPPPHEDVELFFHFCGRVERRIGHHKHDGKSYWHSPEWFESFWRFDDGGWTEQSPFCWDALEKN